MINGGIAKVGLIALVLTLVILLLVLGSAVSSLVPVLVGLTAVFATMGLVSLPSKLVPMDGQIKEVILLIGLAVGVDYSLFYLRRVRDERRSGRSERASIEAAAATSGRAVLISGITVIIAMAGMLLSGDKTFMSFAIGTMMVVAVAMIGSLTVLPALLSRLGDKVEKGRIPFVHRLRRDNGDGSRFWSAILKPVLRHPVDLDRGVGGRAGRARTPRPASPYGRQRARHAAEEPAGAEVVPPSSTTPSRVAPPEPSSRSRARTPRSSARRSPT